MPIKNTAMQISGKRKQGKPQKTWQGTFKEDPQAVESPEEEQRQLLVTAANGGNSSEVRGRTKFK